METEGWGIRSRTRIRPERRVELPLSLLRPVEIIRHDDVHGQAAALVLPRDLEDLLLRLVPQLALPEPEAVLGHLGHRAGDPGIGAHDVGRAVAGDDPVVERARREGLEGGGVLAEDGAPDGRVVPEEAVALGADGEGDRRLRVALRQLDVGALEVRVGLLVLAHAEDLLVRVRGLEPRRQVPRVRAQPRLELTGYYAQSRAFRILDIPTLSHELF